MRVQRRKLDSGFKRSATKLMEEKGRTSINHLLILERTGGSTKKGFNWVLILWQDQACTYHGLQPAKKNCRSSLKAKEISAAVVKIYSIVAA